MGRERRPLLLFWRNLFVIGRMVSWEGEKGGRVVSWGRWERWEGSEMASFERVGG